MVTRACIKRDIEDSIVSSLKEFNYDSEYKELKAPEYYWKDNKSKYIQQIKAVNEKFHTRIITPVDVNRRPGVYEMKVPENLVDKYWDAYNHFDLIDQENQKNLEQDYYTNKPGVQELFKSNPELANIGTPEEYSQYLDTIFPDSKVKDIVYHHSDTKITEFKKEFPEGYAAQKGVSPKAKFFLRKPLKEEFLSKRPYVRQYLINIINPNIMPVDTDRSVKRDSGIKEGIQEALDNNQDGAIFDNIWDNRTWSDVLVVFEPSQIHTLGSKQDIAGFKRFLGRTEEQGSMFGLDLDNQENLEFHINTINAVSNFLNNAGVSQRMVPKFLSQDGTIVEGALAAANFIQGTVDWSERARTEIIDNTALSDKEKEQKMAAYWSKLPEEAAHWWYRLLKENKTLKKALWESHLTAEKANELYRGKYGKLVKSPADLTEEAIGQLIAEAIKRIEEKNASPEDYSFLKNLLKWIKNLLDNWNNPFEGSNSVEEHIEPTGYDIFEVAAMKILSSDMSELMSWEEYAKLNNIVYFTSQLPEGSIAPVDYTLLSKEGILVQPNRAGSLDPIEEEKWYFSFTDTENWGKQSPKFDTREELDNWVLQNIPEHDKRQKRQIREIEANYKLFEKLTKNYFKKRSKFLPKTIERFFGVSKGGTSPTSTLEPFKAATDITKKLKEDEKNTLVEYSLVTPTLNILPEFLKKYNKIPIPLSQPIKINNAKKQETQILEKVRELIKQENPQLKSISAEEFANEVYQFLSANYMLGFNREHGHDNYRIPQTFNHTSYANGPIRHKKIAMRFNDLYFPNSPDAHWSLAPSAFGSLTPFTNDGLNITGVLMHEIQNDNREYLEKLTPENFNLEYKLEQYKKNLNTYHQYNVNIISSGEVNKWMSVHSPIYIGKKLPSVITENFGGLSQLVKDKRTADIEREYRAFTRILREKVDLAAGASDDQEEAYQLYEKAYTNKQRLIEIKRRGGLRSFLTEEEADTLGEMLAEINSLTTNELQNIHFGNKPLLSRKKEIFNAYSKEIALKINERIKEKYGVDIQLTRLDAPAVALPKARQRREVRRMHGRIVRTGNSTSDISTNLNWMLTFNEKELLAENAIEIAQSTVRYNMARSKVVKYNIEKDLLSLSSKQFHKIAEVMIHNYTLAEKITAEHMARREREILGGNESAEDQEALKELLLQEQFELREVYMEEAINLASNMGSLHEQIEKDTKSTLEREKDYFPPLVHEMLQRHIKEHGRDIPLYFSGFDITMNTQEASYSAALYAGPEEVPSDMTPEKIEELERTAALSMSIITDLNDPDYKTKVKEYTKLDKYNRVRYVAEVLGNNNDRPLRIGALYLAMKNIPGIKLTYQPAIAGIINSKGGYLVDLSNYNFTQPLLYGLDTESTPKQKEITPQEQSSSIAEEFITQFMSKLSKITGDMPYSIISEDEAKELTKQSLNPWKNQPAFFIGSHIYFIKGRLSLETTFHEFSHPLMLALQKDNPKLFEKLYQTVVSTPEGQGILNKVIADGTPQETIKEEVLVRALTKLYVDHAQNLEQNSLFVKIANNILYAIKQLLRKLTGKLKISGLSPETSLKDLLNIFNEGKVTDINPEIISREDITAYFTEEDKYLEYLDDFKDLLTEENYKKLREMSTLGYEEASNQIEMLHHNPRYNDIKELLVDKVGRGDLAEILSNLRKFTETAQNKVAGVQDELRYRKANAEAMLNTLIRLDKATQSIFKYLTEMENKNSQEAMYAAYYVSNFLRYWSQFTDQFSEVMAQSDMHNTELRTYVNKINRRIHDTNNIIKEMYSKGMMDLIYDETKHISENVDKYYENIFSYLERTNAPKKIKDKWYKEYHGVTPDEKEELKELEAKSYRTGPQELQLEGLRLKSFKGVKITREKLDKLYTGELGDTNPFSAFLEGYLHSPDNVVGGFALFVKRHLNDVLSDFQRDANKMVQDLGPKLEAMGYDPSNVAGLINQIAYEDVISTFDDETQQMKRLNVWRFLNKFKDYEADLAELDFKVKDAQKIYVFNNSDEARKVLKDTMAEREMFYRKYMHDEFIPEFYAMRKILIRDENDKIGKEASLRQEIILDEITRITQYNFSLTIAYESAPRLKELWREYQYLASIYDKQGKLKEGEELEIAERLREYRIKSIVNPITGITENPYVDIPRSGVFQNTYQNYHKELLSRIPEGIDPDEAEMWVQSELDKWVIVNTRVKIKQEYFEEKSFYLQRIAEIEAQIKQPERKEITEKISNLYKERTALMKPYKDKDGQPEGQLIHEQKVARIKKIEEEIIALKKTQANSKGLTQEDYDERTRYWETPESQRNPDDLANINLVKREAADIGLPPLLLKQLRTYYKKLGELSHKEATDYYIKAVNELLLTFDNNVKSINENTADNILNLAVVDELSKNPQFKEWFHKNHIQKEKLKKNGKGRVKYWERLPIWNATLPADEEYYEKTILKDENGVAKKTINRVPDMAYFYRGVKPEYRTGYDPTTGHVKYIIGVHKDNRGRFLPRTDVEDKKYLNSRYTNLDSQTRDLLDAFVEWHLKSQEGAPVTSRLWMDIPRFRKTNLELARTSQIKRVMGKAKDGDKDYPILGTFMKFVRLFWNKGKDQPESGYKWKDDIQFARADLFDNETSRIPIQGIYKMDIDEVSTDITQGMLRYMLSVKKQKKLLEIQPVAKAIQESMPDDVNEKLNRGSFVAKQVLSYLPGKKGKKSTRKQAIENLIEREFYGQKNTGILSDDPIANNLSKFMLGAASMKFFALDIPSGLKNTLGAKFQGIIQAASGEHMTLSNFIKGEAWSASLMGEISVTLYNHKVKSLKQQLAEIFDPVQDRLESKLPQILSRNLSEDAASFSWLYNFRKWTETQATMQMFAGVMYTEQVKKDGQYIDYIDAWELKDGLISLKDGIDPEYGQHKVVYTPIEGDTIESVSAKYFITPAELKERMNSDELIIGKEITIANSKKFNIAKNKIHTIFNNLQGSYAHFDQPEAQRYLAFRFLSFLRRYFTTMFMNRAGFARISPGMGTVTEGYYTTVIKTAINAFTISPATLAHLTPREKVAMIKFLVEIGSVLVLTAVLLPLLGWDDKDPEKYDKMRERSGDLQIPGLTVEDPEHPFKTMGWLHNHLISLAMKLSAENATFLPFPGPDYGLHNYKDIASPQSIAFGPTLDSYLTIFSMTYGQVTGDPGAYYKRAVGPYKWQDEGGSKAMTYLMRSLGFTGSTLSPLMSVKNVQGVKSKNK